MPRRHTILVVDDEPDVVKSVKDLLRLDYTVLTATKAEDGMHLMEQNQVDVVMTDQRMPETTGVEFLSHVKGPYPEATRLLFTGYADIRAVIDAINQGNVYRYITKPWDPDELQTVIREACERHDLIVQRRELTDALEAKNTELQNVNEELRQANELKTAFIQVASHELRTPLSILSGYSELSSRAPELREPLKDWIKRIATAAKRLQYLVSQMIDMLQAGQFQAKLNRQSTDIAALLEEAIADVEPFIVLRHQTLKRDWAADIGSIDLDAPKIRDSLNHILLNAIKFTPDNGTITVTASRTDDNGVRIAISDTGCGIDPAHLPRIGEAFFTGYDVARHSSGSYEHGRQGLGLGVSVVKKFIDLHGGKFDLQSEVGRGTTVTLTIPKAPPA